MVIRDLSDKLNYDELLNVYCIYWIKEKTYFCCSPKNYEGLSVYSEDKIEVVDNSLSNEFMLVKSVTSSFDMLLHKSLAENNLLDRLIDDGQGNYAEFMARLGHEP